MRCRCGQWESFWQNSEANEICLKTWRQNTWKHVSITGWQWFWWRIPCIKWISCLYLHLSLLNVCSLHRWFCVQPLKCCFFQLWKMFHFFASRSSGLVWQHVLGHYPPVLWNHILSVLQHVAEWEHLQSGLWWFGQKPLLIFTFEPLWVMNETGQRCQSTFLTANGGCRF